MASTRLTGSGISKWVPSSSAMVRSISAWSQSRNASTPSIDRVGSVSSRWTTAGKGSPGMIRPATLALAQRRLEAGQRLGHPLHPCRDHLPIGIGCGGHQIEALTDALERASDDAEITQALAGLVLVDGDLEALAHHLYRHPFRLGQEPNLR